jgi:two-component system phosphate regulon sensor histidine kinase PhoR
MAESWSKEFWRLILDLTLFWLLGLIAGYPLWGVIGGFVFYLALLARRAWKFEQWLGQKLTDPPEQLSGVFEELAYKIYRIRNRSRKRKKRMSELLRRWQDSSAALPDAAVLLNPDTSIAWFNSTASSMLGLKTTDSGHYIGNLIRSPRFVHYIKSADYAEPLEIASPVDEGRTLSIRMTPYGKSQQLMLVSDVTHIQRLMTMRRDFIANVSHELRTPLTVIMGYIETLRDDEDCDRDTLKDTMKRIEAPATRMKSLVEDLLLLSSLDTGAPGGLETSSLVNVAALVKNMVAEAEQISQGRHKIVVDVERELQLKGVEKEIYSAFANLVTNAVRYTREGTTVTISWHVQSDGARFCVTDDGQGIAPEHLPRLTERFYRVDVGRSRQTGGTGLGLAIVKQVLRRHDGELDVYSVLGKGSEFCCRFPTARVVSGDRPPEACKILAS